MHEILHIVAFGFPAFLLQVILNRRHWAWVAALVLFSALCLAVGIELAQSLMYKNAFEWVDLRDDLLGTALAILPRLLVGDRRGRDAA